MDTYVSWESYRIWKNKNSGKASDFHSFWKKVTFCRLKETKKQQMVAFLIFFFFFLPFFKNLNLVPFIRKRCVSNVSLTCTFAWKMKSSCAACICVSLFLCCTSCFIHTPGYRTHTKANRTARSRAQVRTPTHTRAHACHAFLSHRRNLIRVYNV